MSTRTVKKVIHRTKPDGTVKEYEYEYEVPVKTGKPGRKSCPNRQLLRSLDITEEEATKLINLLTTIRNTSEKPESKNE